MDEIFKAELPPSELGNDRCFQIKHSGHGDLLMAAWNGSIDLIPAIQRDKVTQFAMYHGSEIMIIAGLSGYLKRLGRSDEEVSRVMHMAGDEILGDPPENLLHYHNLSQSHINRVANGGPFSRFNVLERGLEALTYPISAQPGVLEQTGGTGMYCREAKGSGLRFVLAGFEPTGGEAVIDRTFEFCEQDVPVLGRLVCETALGEYRRDIQAFLTNLQG
jgi:hypothetical protein